MNVFTPGWLSAIHQRRPGGYKTVSPANIKTAFRKKEQETSSHKVLSHLLHRAATRKQPASTWAVQTPARLVDCTSCYASECEKLGHIGTYRPATLAPLGPFCTHTHTSTDHADMLCHGFAHSHSPNGGHPFFIKCDEAASLPTATLTQLPGL